MKRAFPFFFYCLIVMNCHAWATPDVSHAEPSSYALQILQRALQQEKTYRQTVSWELRHMLRQFPISYTSELKERCVNRIKKDLDHAKALHHYLDDFKAKNPQALSNDQLSWPLANNKMILALEGALQILEVDFERFMGGAYIKKYLQDLETTAVMDYYERPIQEFNGNAWGTYIKTAAAIVLAEIAPDQADVEQDVLDPDNSYIFHRVPFPKGFDPLQVSETFEEFSFFRPAAEKNMRAHFVFPHSGYTYGGVRNRKEAKYLEDPLSCPQDCSSWVGDLLGIEYLSTYQLSFFHRQKRLGLTPTKTMDRSDRTIMRKYDHKLEPIVLESLEQVRPGDLYVHRVIDEGNHATNGIQAGTGGHAGLVTAVNVKEGSVTILGINRLIPHIEGYGFFQCPVYDIPSNRMVLFFRVKEPV